MLRIHFIKVFRYFRRAFSEKQEHFLSLTAVFVIENSAPLRLFITDIFREVNAALGFSGM